MHSSRGRPGRSLPKIGKALLLGALCTSVSTIPLNNALALDENALPNGGTVVGGNAKFDYSQPGQLHINQTSDRAVINWNSFNIGKDALTQFHQNSSSSIAVNKVTSSGVNPTQILGSLKANGRVVVLDRNGVIFGEGSRVDVGGIIASTGTIDDAAFMSGNNFMKIDQATDGQIIMNGQMNISQAGLAAFVAPTVINNGVIVAKLGSVQLGAGSSATLDLYGDGLMEVAVDQDSLKTIAENNGIIQAPGGKVLITAASAKKIVDSTVNMTGTVDVSSITEEGGKIILTGDQTLVSGTLDASGHKGGGKILVGGEYQGGGTTARAKTTVITKNAVLKANTTGASGNGGEIIAWADGNTQFDGKIEAKAGSVSGNGGLVETSGKKNLGVTGSVDASAAHGKAGEWLLDPSNVSIRATGGNNIPTSGGTNNAASDNYFISDSSIEAALNLGNNVTITTTNASGTEAGNIDFDWGGVVINKTAGASATLTFKANGSIDFTNSIITSSGAGNALNVVGWADFDGTGNDGSIAAYGSITTNGGNIYLVGGLDNGANGGVVGDGIGDNYASNGVVLNGANLNAQGGNIVINAQHTGNNGLVMQGGTTVQTSGNGNITARGIGTTVGFGWSGGVLVQGNSTVRAENGTINITGTNTAATGMGVGVEMNGGGQVYTTGTTGGNINITGTRTGSTSNYAKGIELDGDTTRVYSNNGNIVLNGTATTSTASVEAHGIYNINGADIYSTGSGTVELTGTGTATTGASTDIITTGTGAANLGDAGGMGSLTVNANTVDFANTSTLVRTQGSVLFKPRTASTTIGLGGGTGTLNLSDTELGYISAGTLIIGDSAAGAGDVDLDSWNLSGKTHNVEVYGNDIDLGGITLGSGNFTAHAKDAGGDLGNMTVSVATTKSVAGNSTLTLNADQNIQFYGSANITASTGSLNVVLNADRDADLDGAISIPNLTITTNGGYFVAGGGSGKLWGLDGIKGNTDDAASTGADNTAAWGNSILNSGVFVTSSTINTGAGDLYINGQGHTNGALSDLNGIWINGGTVRTTSGKIYLTGTAGAGTVGNGGITIQNSAAVTTATGLITAKGKSANVAGGYNNYGINIFSSGKIESTGTGAGAANIILEGTNYSNVGGFGFNDGKVTSIDGDIQMTSYAGDASKNNIVHMIGTSSIEATGDGNITIETVGGNSAGNSIAFVNGQNQRIGSATMTGDITLITNDIDSLEATDSIITQGAVYLRPSVNSNFIGLGGGSGGFNLDDTELGAISAGTKLVIGSLAGTGDIDLDTWNLSGKTYNVEIYGNDIDVGGLTLGSGNFFAYAKRNGGDNGELVQSANITKSVAGTSTLTFKADNSVTVKSIVATTGKLNTVFWTDADNTGNDGMFNATASTVTTNGGNIYAVGGLDNGANGGTAADGIADNYTGEGTILWGSVYNAGGGDIFMNAKGATGNGLYFGNGSQVITNSLGNITLRGIGGTGDYNAGIMIQASGAANTISAENGTIQLIGSNINASQVGQGIIVDGGSQIKTTGTTGGNIILDGTRNNSTSWYGAGIEIYGDGSSVNTNHGDITFNGSATTGSDWVSSSGTYFRDGGDTYSTNGAITFNTSATAGTVNSGSIADVQTAGSGTSNIGSGSATGNITFNSNSIDLANTNTNIQTTGSILVKPRTASTSIGLGGGTGTLNLTDAELSYFNGGRLIIGDSVSGTGDIDLDNWNFVTKSFNVDLYGNDIDLGGLTLGSGNVTAYAKDNGTDYGTLTVSAPLSKSVAGASTLTLRADKDVVFNSGSNLTTTTGTTNLIVNSDVNSTLDGGITITSSALNTNGGTITLNSNGNAVTQSGTIGGHETINSGNGAVLIGALNGNTAGTRDLTVNAGTGTFTTAGIIGGTSKLRNVTISADNMALGANIGGTGTLTLETGTSDRNININIGTDDGSALHLTTAELGHLVNGWADINLGRSDRMSYIDMGATSWADPLTLRGDAGINGVLTGIDNASFTSQDYIDLAYNIITDGENINFGSGYISLKSSTAGLYSHSGNISARLHYGNNEAITLDAGTGGNVSITSGTPITAITDLTIKGYTVNFATPFTNVKNLNITSANSFTLPSVTTTAGGSVVATVTSPSNGIITSGAISTGDLTFIADSLNIGANVTATGSILLKPYAASTTIGLGGGAGSFHLSDAELAYFTGANLAIGDSGSGSGHVDIDSWDLSSKAANVQVHGGTIDLGGIILGSGDVTLYAEDDLTVSAASTSASAGDLTLLSKGNVAVNAGITNTGTGTRNIFAGWDGTSAITTPALFDLDDVALGTPAHNIVLGSAGSVSSAGTGTSVLLVASGAFDNNATAGANAITAASGRYLIYSDNPANTDKNGLTAKSLYNKTYAAALPSSITGGSRFVYKYQPTLVFTPDNISTADVSTATYTYATSGLVNGDLIADAFSGLPSYSLGAVTGNTQVIHIAQGTVLSSIGYALDFSPTGVLTNTAAPVTPPTPPAPTPPVTATPSIPTDGKIPASTVITQAATKQEETATTAAASDAKDTEASDVSSCLVADASGCLIK